MSTLTFALSVVKVSFVSLTCLQRKVRRHLSHAYRDYAVMCLTSTSRDIFDRACNYITMEQAKLVTQSGPAGYCRNTICMCMECPDHIWSPNTNFFLGTMLGTQQTTTSLWKGHPTIWKGPSTLIKACMIDHALTKIKGGGEGTGFILLPLPFLSQTFIIIFYTKERSSTAHICYI